MRWVISPPSSTRTQAPPGASGVAGVGERVGGLGPDRRLGVDTDAVRAEAVGPDAPTGEAAVLADVERHSRPANDSDTTSVEPSGVTTMPLGNWMSLGDPAVRPVRRDEVDPAGLRGRAAGEVEVGAVDVDVAARVDDDLVGAVVAQCVAGPSGSRRVTDSPGGDQAAVGQPVDRPAHEGRAVRHHLGVPVEVDGHDLAHAPVREPEPPVVPAGGLDHREAGEQGAGGRQVLDVDAHASPRTDPGGIDRSDGTD